MQCTVQLQDENELCARYSDYRNIQVLLVLFVHVISIQERVVVSTIIRTILNYHISKVHVDHSIYTHTFFLKINLHDPSIWTDYASDC